MADGPREGDMAPDFTLSSDDSGEVSLSDYRGQRVVLYFYPKDDTSGCTRQACDLRDAMPRFEAEDAVVLGVSPDPVESHAAFREKYDLNFTLLADTEHEVSKAYGVWKDRPVWGMGIERSTFLIDEDGEISDVWRGVKAGKHAEWVAERL